MNALKWLNLIHKHQILPVPTGGSSQCHVMRYVSLVATSEFLPNMTLNQLETNETKFFGSYTV